MHCWFEPRIGSILFTLLCSSFGPTQLQEHSKAVQNMGYSPTDVAAIIAANQVAYGEILAALVSEQGYDWQAFGSEGELGP